jgi:hypothetical protein
MEDYSLFARLQRKLSKSEADMLRKEVQNDLTLPELPRKHKQKTHPILGDHMQVMATCGHYFIGEHPCDPLCESCGCRERGYCFPQCLCSPKCPLRRVGCNCKKEDCRTKKCPCFNDSR